MSDYLNFNDFQKNWNKKQNHLLTISINSDTITPVSALLKLEPIQKYIMLFESVENNAYRNRYSTIIIDPDLIWECKNNQATIKTFNQTDSEKNNNLCNHSNDIFDSFRKFYQASQMNLNKNIPPIASGIYGYMGYDMIKFMERIRINDKIKQSDNIKIPDSIFIRPRITIVFDSISDSILVSAPFYHDKFNIFNNFDNNHQTATSSISNTKNLSSEQSDEVKHTQFLEKIFKQKQQQIFNIINLLLQPLSSKECEIHNQNIIPNHSKNQSNANNNDINHNDNIKNISTKDLLKDLCIDANMTAEEYKNLVKQSIEYINEGEIFQILPSRRLSCKFDKKPIDFYRILRRMNPSPFLFFSKFDNFIIAGSSPEIMVRTNKEYATIRPLAGTRVRGNTEEEDKLLAKELLSDQKEVAEHLMLIDLARHDLGRISKPKTIKVDKYMQIELYSHVMHISSNVSGKVNWDKYDPIDVLIAGFPPGTVSGAPKIRAIELLYTIEKDKRSFYSGCIGYLSSDGKTMDTALMLRTALIKDNKIYLHTGAGIVADSNEESEFQETLNKARVLIQSIYNLQTNN